MHAVVRREYGDWRKLSLESVPLPTLKKDQMLVKVEFAAIDASMDHLMRGDPTLVRLMLGLSKPKHIGVGQSFSGTVVDTGVTEGFAVGDKVFGVGQGTFADYATTKSSWITKVPDGLSMQKAATIPVSGITANDALKLLPPGAEHALVIGASGAVGGFLTQLLNQRGIAVTATASPSKSEWVKLAGASEVIGHDEVANLERNSFDVIFVLGGANPLKDLTPLLSEIGLVVLIGSDRGGSKLFGGYLASALETRLSKGKQKMIFSQDTQETRSSVANQIQDLSSLAVVAGELGNAIELIASYQRGESHGRPVISFS